jgi:hypothetical protein
VVDVPIDLRRPGSYADLRRLAAAAPSSSVFAIEVVWRGHARWCQPDELARRLRHRTWPRGTLVRMYKPADFLRYLDGFTSGVGSSPESLPPLVPVYD